MYQPPPPVAKRDQPDHHRLEFNFKCTCRLYLREEEAAGRAMQSAWPAQTSLVVYSRFPHMSVVAVAEAPFKFQISRPILSRVSEFANFSRQILPLLEAKHLERTFEFTARSAKMNDVESNCSGISPTTQRPPTAQIQIQMYLPPLLARRGSSRTSHAVSLACANLPRSVFTVSPYVCRCRCRSSIQISNLPPYIKPSFGVRKFFAADPPFVRGETPGTDFRIHG